MPSADQMEKLRELMLFIATRSRFDKWFGATKLNKIMFHAEFRFFQRYGKHITGASYRRLARGPVLRPFKSVVAQLEESKAAIMDEVPIGENVAQHRLVARRESNLSLFTAMEIAIIDEVIDELRDMNGKQLSDASHEHRGWQLVEHGEDIPYETAFLADGPPVLTDDQIAFGQSLASRRG